MSTVRLGDARARHAAVTSLDGDCVVVAGAGTGKTSLLVERLLFAIGCGRTRLDTTAAITFTKKAAGEMRDRLGEALATLAAGTVEDDAGHPARRALDALAEAVDEVPAERWLEAEEQLDRAVIDTIHGFCARILREFPLEAGVDPAFRVDEGEGGRRVRDEVWTAWLDRAAGDGGPDWSSLDSRVEPGDLRDVAFALLEQEVDPDPGADAERRRACERDLADALHARAAAVRAWLGARSHHEKTRAVCEALAGWLESADADRLDAWSRAAPAILEKPLTSNSGFGYFAAKAYGGAEAKDAAKRDVKAFFAKLDDVRRADDGAVESVRRFLAPFLREARTRIAAAGWIGFEGLLRRTDDLLREHPEIATRLRGRYRTLLLDEVQDTDPTQYSIVRALRDARPREASADPAPGLFLVGDPKQSIYRFRGADVSAFRRELDHWTATGAESLELTTNFRSDPRVLDPVNRLFSGPDSPWEPRPGVLDAYVPLEAFRPADGDGPAVEVWTIEGAGKAYDARRIEGVAVARAIEAELGAGREPGDIALLLRKLTQVEAYLRPLRLRGIPFVVDGGRVFAQRIEVRELLATARAVVRPSDTPARLAFFRSAWGAVPDDELTRHVVAGGRLEFGAPAPDRSATPRLAEAWATLEALRERRAETDDATWFRGLLEPPEVLALHAAAFEGAQRVVNLQRLAETAERWIRRDGIPIDRVLDRLADEDSPPIEKDASLADAGREAVRVLTVHKAKGLEFPVVFLAGLGEKSGDGGRRNTTSVRRVRTADGRETVAVKTGAVFDRLHAYERLENDRHRDAEDLRLLYVAATRAESRLVLTDSRATTRSSSVVPIGLRAARAGWGLEEETPHDALLAGGAVRHRRFEADDLRDEVRVEERAAETLPTVPPSRSPRELPGHPRLRTVRDAANDDAGAERDGTPTADAGRAGTERPAAGARRVAPTDAGLPLFDRVEERPASRAGGSVRDSPKARAVGTVLHRALERLPARDPDPLPALVREEAPQVAADVGGNAADPSAWLDEAVEIAESFSAGTLGERWRGGRPVAREWPVLFRDADGVGRAGTIDLVFQHDGEIVVVDFKTDRETDDDALRRAHGTQLALYADALLRAGAVDAPPSLELWLLRQDRALAVTRG